MPDRATDFADAMKWHAILPGFSVPYLVAAFPWGSGGELTLMDIGGELGHVSRALVYHSPTVKCIVQDSPDVIVQGQEGLPACLQERISFQPHDIFREQPMKGADVYRLRLVLHEWSDKYSKMIIKALIPALRPGVKIVIHDRVIPGRGKTSYLAEREARSAPLYMPSTSKANEGFHSDYDMYMLALQNGKERTADEWSMLFKEADPRFKLTSIPTT